MTYLGIFKKRIIKDDYMFNRNNLDKARSPYLQQHKNNPVHWQEWNKKTLDLIKKEKKPLFISVGYSTCHWCHVMAHESFEDKDVANFLNKNFVCIKVDREERPDIDQYLMSYMVRTQGQGGWPLNVFLTYDLKPFFALTYAPVVPKYGMPAFIDLLKSVFDFLKNNDNVDSYEMESPISSTVNEENLIATFKAVYDKYHGGFAGAPKFPPYNSLLFLSNFAKDKEVKDILEHTLDVMSMRGLHDHLQGGFYRYCTDNNWTIPHFEKMLYDQAMMLMVYSSGYKLFKKEEYKIVVEKLIKCLNETFRNKDVFYSGHDADTNHEEGLTYLWSTDELKNILKNDFVKFSEVYEIGGDANFEGKNHLIKKNNVFLSNTEEKLLKIRIKREQPFTDKKIITSWNALIGIGLVYAYRYCDLDVLQQAIDLFRWLINKHVIPSDNKKLVHSSIDGILQDQGFLEDYASMLVLATYLHEETGNFNDEVEWLRNEVLKFKENVWIESNNEDFMSVIASSYDHPIPSSVSMAEFGILRSKLLFKEDYTDSEYKDPLSFDFFNLVALISQGNTHVVTSPEKIDWDKLPLNTIQVKDDEISDCYERKCIKYDSINELIKKLL